MTYPPPPPSGDQPSWPPASQPPGNQPAPGEQPAPGGQSPGGQSPWPGTQPMPGYQPPGGPTPGYQQPGYQPPGYQPPAGYQQGGYQPPGTPAPGYQQQWPGQQPAGPRGTGPLRRDGTLRYALMGVAGGVVLVLIIVLIGVAAGGNKSSPNSGSSGSGAPQAGSSESSAATGSSSAPESPAPSGSSSGPIGTTFRVTGFDHSQKTDTYDVTLIAVSQNAAPKTSFDAAKAGNHLAYAEIKVTAVTGHPQDDANLDATAHGSNQQAYQPSFDSVAAGTNFSDGDFDLNPGQTVIGYVSYEVPNSTKITSVAWDSNLQGSVVTWTV